MNKKVITGIVALVVVVAFGAWLALGGDSTAPSSTADSTGSDQAGEVIDQTTESEAVSDAATITFTNNGFTPNSLTVKKGTVITVKNESSMSVQFSSDDHPTHRLNTEMNMSTLAAGKSGSFTAETVGTHGFHDHINDEFTGTLIVTE